MNIMKIGYQGISGSNSETAAIEMANKNQFVDVEYVPLTTSHRVIEALQKNLIDYGVVATKNSIGGEVDETMKALKNTHLELVSTVILPIHHCIFKKREDSSIRRVASHIQALKQTSNWISTNMHFDIEKQEIEDTAIGAEMLKSGTLGEDTAVICSKQAGEKNKLYLIAQNIEDDKNNRTEFRLFKLPDPQYVEDHTLSDGFIDERSLVDKLIQALIILTIIASFFVMSYFNMSPLETAFTISSYVVMLYLLFVKMHRKLINKTFVGYWKYYTKPLDSVSDVQHYHVPRIVEIAESDGKLKLSGYTSGNNEKIISFTSDKVYVDNIGSSHGYFLYEYSSDANALDLGGYVLLNWKKRFSYAKVKTMNGKYFGVRSREIGQLVYQRISKTEFENIRKSEFLINNK